jgi:outer membrane protein assembly factor BamB
MCVRKPLRDLTKRTRAGQHARMLSPRILLLPVLLAFAGPLLAENWPAWRGPEGTGITRETNLPTQWSATENVRWKTQLPERGNSTPVVWGDRVFLTQAEGERRLVMCFDRATGRELWRSGPAFKGPDPTHATNPFAAASPVTDGERVIAWFGSAGLWCFDLQGRELWHKDLGKQEHIWGYASSPVLHGDLCFLNFGPGEQSFLLAVEKATGKEVWRVDLPREHPAERHDGFAGRQGEIGSWSTPLIVRVGDRDELVLTVPGWVKGYDPTTGRELWRCGGLNPLIYTSPVAGEGVVVAMGGFGGSDLAVKLGGSGDVTGTHRLWHHLRGKQRIGSCVITGGHAYILNTPGTAQCIELQTGKPAWEERLQGPTGRSESWSSMVLSGDRLYVLNQAGDTFILRASPKFEKLAVNAIGDGMTNASHAVSNGELFIRTHKHLWCIGAK